MNDSSRQLGKLISDRDRHILEMINYVVLVGAISLFGVFANFMNIVVFYKQGFKTTVNISFFGLAISDQCGLLTLIWFSIGVNPLFINAGVPVSPHEVLHLLAGAPHACLTRITSWITVFITAERCLCIILPLKIKRIVTPRRATLSVCSIYIAIMTSFLPEYVTSYFDWKFYPGKNRTLLGLAFKMNRKSVEGLIFMLNSVLGSTSFIAVIVLTVLLVVQLKQKSKWRRSANVDTTRVETISTRDRRTSNTVVMIATVLIVCYSPGVAVSLVTFFQPEVNTVGIHVNTFYVLWSFVFVFDSINSSVNIFLYYNMSSKYRATFHQVFCIGNTKTEGIA